MGSEALTEDVEDIIREVFGDSDSCSEPEGPSNYSDISMDSD